MVIRLLGKYKYEVGNVETIFGIICATVKGIARGRASLSMGYFDVAQIGLFLVMFFSQFSSQIMHISLGMR